MCNKCVIPFAIDISYPTCNTGKVQGVPKVRSSYFLRYNFWSKLYSYMKFLLLHQLHIFRISVISIPPLSRIQHVEPQMMYFEIFYHLLRRSHFNAQTVFFWIRQLQKIYTLGIHSKKGNHLGPIYSNAFVPLFKFETSWSLLRGLIGGFFPYVRASNLRFSWTCSRLGLLSVVRATSLSFLFCT